MVVGWLEWEFFPANRNAFMIMPITAGPRVDSDQLYPATNKKLISRSWCPHEQWGSKCSPTRASWRVRLISLGGCSVPLSCILCTIRPVQFTPSAREAWHLIISQTGHMASGWIGELDYTLCRERCNKPSCEFSLPRATCAKSAFYLGNLDCTETLSNIPSWSSDYSWKLKVIFSVSSLSTKKCT